MSGSIIRIAAVVFVLVFLYNRQSASSARVWLPPPVPAVNRLPDNPNDPYYNKYQTVPSIEDTANKFMSNFLFINPTNTRRKRRGVPVPIDNVIVMDGSVSVGDCEFKRGKVAIKNMMKSVNAIAIKEGYDEKYSAVTFSTSASVNFKFLRYSEAVQRLSMINFPSGVTNTQAGLAEARNLFLESMTGGRFANRKNVLLITDGQSNVDKHLTVRKATNLKNFGVNIYVFAVGSYIPGIGEMVQVAGNISSTKPDGHLFRVEGYEKLAEFSKLVVEKVASTGKYRHSSLNPDPSPC